MDEPTQESRSTWDKYEAATFNLPPPYSPGGPKGGPPGLPHRTPEQEAAYMKSLREWNQAKDRKSYGSYLPHQLRQTAPAHPEHTAPNHPASHKRTPSEEAIYMQALDAWHRETGGECSERVKHDGRSLRRKISDWFQNGPQAMANGPLYSQETYNFEGHGRHDPL